MKKIFRNKKGVSEIVGTILLLGMAIALFVGVHIVALDIIPYTPNAPSVKITGMLEYNTIYIQHKGGDTLSLNTKVIFSNYTTGNTILDDTVDGNIAVSDEVPGWNIGEVISYSHPQFIENSTLMIIIDVQSNAIIAQDIFHEVI